MRTRSGSAALHLTLPDISMSFTTVFTGKIFSLEHGLQFILFYTFSLKTPGRLSVTWYPPVTYASQ